MSGLRRRELLRWAALAGLAACQPVRRPPIAPGTAASPTAPVPTGSPQSTEPQSTAPPPVAPVVVPMVCRAAWGARPAGTGLQPHTVTRLTVHHSAVAARDTTQGPGHLRDYQAFHVDGHGWPDIAYHVAVDRAGVAYQLRDWATVGDTGTAYDPTGHFLLLLDGNFEEHDVSGPQLAAAARVLAWAAGHFGVGLDTVSGHRDHTPDTACPGDALYARLGELADVAATVRAAADPVLAMRCGDRAREAVAALEAGRRPDLLT